MRGCPLLLTSYRSRAWWTAVCLLVRSATQSASAVTVAANTPGLYDDYYNSGFASTPITGLPNFAALSLNSSTFAYNVTGQPTDPQQYTSDTYCGGVFHGYLYTTISYGVYIVGVQSKDGFALTLANSTIGSNSEFVIQHCSVQDSSCEMQFVHILSHSG